MLQAFRNKFPSIDDDVLSYGVSVLEDDDYRRSDRVQIVVDLLVSHDVEDVSILSSVEELVEIFCDPVENEGAVELFAGALRQGPELLVRAPAAQWASLSEITLMSIVGEYADCVSMLRSARTCRAFAAVAQLALKYKGAGTLDQLSRRVRGTLLLRAKIFPERRRLPDARAGSRVTSLRAAGRLLLIGQQGLTFVYRSSGLSPHLVGSFRGNVEWAVAHGSILAVAMTSQASAGTTLAVYDFETYHTCGSLAPVVPPLASVVERGGRIVGFDLAPVPHVSSRLPTIESLVLLTAFAARSGKKTVVRLRHATTMLPFAAGSSAQEAHLAGASLEVGSRFNGAVLWGATVAVAAPEGDCALGVWRIPTSSVPKFGRIDPRPTWPRRGDVVVRCDGDRQKLLIYSKAVCPTVSVWQAGSYDVSKCNFRLAMAASGELLTSHIAADEGRLRSMSVGAGVVIMDGLVAHELLFLLTSDGSVRAWRLDEARPQGSIAPAASTLHRNLPVPLLKLRWTIRSAHLVLVDDQVDLVCQGTHSFQPAAKFVLPFHWEVPQGGSTHETARAEHGSVTVNGFGPSYDPGPFEWFRFALDGPLAPGFACSCGLKCTASPLETMRGEQVLISCPIGAQRRKLVRVTPGTGGSASAAETGGSALPSKGDQRGCAVSIWADELVVHSSIPGR